MLRPTLLWIVIFSAALATLPCFGQTFGEITGVVTDSSGGLVVGATVTVTNPETGVTRTATTNTAGNYTFPSLLPGIYSVKSEMQGFQAEIRNGVELQVQQVARIDFQLKVGSMAETIRPNAMGASTSLSNPTTGEWFNIQAFALQPLGTFGQITSTRSGIDMRELQFSLKLIL